MQATVKHNASCRQLSLKCFPSYLFRRRGLWQCEENNAAIGRINTWTFVLGAPGMNHIYLIEYQETCTGKCVDHSLLFTGEDNVAFCPGSSLWIAGLCNSSTHVYYKNPLPSERILSRWNILSNCSPQDNKNKRWSTKHNSQVVFYHFFIGLIRVDQLHGTLSWCHGHL